MLLGHFDRDDVIEARPAVDKVPLGRPWAADVVMIDETLDVALHVHSSIDSRSSDQQLARAKKAFEQALDLEHATQQAAMRSAPCRGHVPGILLADSERIAFGDQDALLLRCQAVATVCQLQPTLFAAFVLLHAVLVATDGLG